VSTLLGILIAVASVVTLAVIAWAFIWAAKKDGEEDRTVQKRSASYVALGSGDSPRPTTHLPADRQGPFARRSSGVIPKHWPKPAS
jgi:nitrogen fixation-related uncharacterized protein